MERNYVIVNLCICSPIQGTRGRNITEEKEWWGIWCPHPSWIHPCYLLFVFYLFNRQRFCITGVKLLLSGEVTFKPFSVSLLSAKEFREIWCNVVSYGWLVQHAHIVLLQFYSSLYSEPGMVGRAAVGMAVWNGWGLLWILMGLWGFYGDFWTDVRLSENALSTQ